MAFQTLNINGRIKMNSRVMNENGREDWTEKTYQEKNQEKGNHYNFARSSKNFEIYHGKNFYLNSRKHIPIEQRLDARLAELGFHYYKEDSKNAPYSVADIIVGGDHERMCEIANNPHTLNAWAHDNYRFFCEKFGEDNIISFCVHMDETTPHAHVLVIPTAIKKQRGRMKSGTARKDKEVVSFKSHFGDLSKANSRKAAYQRWHDDYYNAVGKKWGFERGRDLDKMSPEMRAEHTHLHKTELDTRNRLRAENKDLFEFNKHVWQNIQEKQKKVDDLQATVDNKEKRANDLDTTLVRKRMEFATLTSDIAAKQAEKESLDNSISAKKQEKKQLENDIIELQKKKKANSIDYRKELNKVLDEWIDSTWNAIEDKLIDDAENTGIRHLTPQTAYLIETALPHIGDEDWRIRNIDCLVDEAKEKIAPQHANWVELLRNDCRDVIINGAEQYCEHIGYSRGQGV